MGSFTPHRIFAAAAHPLAELLLVGLAALAVALLGAHADAYPVDSYFYLAKARSLASGHLLHVNWGDGIDRRFFWGYSIALAPWVRLFGAASFWLLAALLHASTGLVLSRILRMLPLEVPARIGALALALFSPVALRWATVPTAEPLLLALSSGAVLFALRYRAGSGTHALLFAGALGGAALLTQVEGLFVAAGVGALCGPRLLRQGRATLYLAFVGLALVPELAHLVYLALHAPPALSFSAQLDTISGPAGQVPLLRGFFVLLRAPFWAAFAFDGEPWLHSQYFPTWLTALQGLVLALYALAVVAALATGFFRRTFAFSCAAALCGYALLHALLFRAHERFGYVAAPLAAALFAWAAQGAFSWARERVRAGAVLAVCLGAAAVSGVCGVRASRLNAAHLRADQGGRDLQAVARAVNQAVPPGRTVVTDLGPPLAYYLASHAFFDRATENLHDDQVPPGDAARVFFARHRVGAVVSTRASSVLAQDFALVPDELRELSASGATLLLVEPEAMRVEGQ